MMTQSLGGGEGLEVVMVKLGVGQGSNTGFRVSGGFANWWYSLKVSVFRAQATTS